MESLSRVLFVTEYIPNVLYFSVVRDKRITKDNNSVHFFCIDDELVYENYFCDFGPLNLSCVYKYCHMVTEKLSLYMNVKKIVHYTKSDDKKKANAAFLMGAYGVICLNMTPKEAMAPLMRNNQSYRPFQDATYGKPVVTISIFNCLCALKKAKDLSFFKIDDFDVEEYERLNKIQNGDLNWIVPAKFLAFIGPIVRQVTFEHPPELYIKYFLENNVKVVIRLNKKLYEASVFESQGIKHYDLFFPDGSCPPKNIVIKFLKISEDNDCAIGVHCKAGLGRTGSLIGCYLIKHYKFTALEAIAWMRICRPGSVIGHQQTWLEHMEPWLHKQGVAFRKENFLNVDKISAHPFGIYSMKEKSLTKSLPKKNKEKSNNVSAKSRMLARPMMADPERLNDLKLCERLSWQLTKKNQLFKWEPTKNSLQNSHARSSIKSTKRPFPELEGRSLSAQQPPRPDIEHKHKNILSTRGSTDRKELQLRKEELLTNMGDIKRTFQSSEAQKKFLENVNSKNSHKSLLKSKTFSNYDDHWTDSDTTEILKSRDIYNKIAPKSNFNKIQHRNPSKLSKTDSTSTHCLPRRDSAKKWQHLSDVESKFKSKPHPRQISAGASTATPPWREAKSTFTPSVCSEDVHKATQGDLLNSVKFQRTVRKKVNLSNNKSSHICTVSNDSRNNSAQTTKTKLNEAKTNSKLFKSSANPINQTGYELMLVRRDLLKLDQSTQ